MDTLLTWGPVVCAVCAAWVLWPRLKVLSYLAMFPQLRPVSQAKRRYLIKKIESSTVPSWKTWVGWAICVYAPAKALDVALLGMAPRAYTLVLALVILVGPLVCGPGIRVAMAMDHKNRERIRRILESVLQMEEH